LRQLWHDQGVKKTAVALQREIRDGIQQHALHEHPKFGTVYCYEVDGLGGCTLMDDANVPRFQTRKKTYFWHNDFCILLFSARSSFSSFDPPSSLCLLLLFPSSSSQFACAAVHRSRSNLIRLGCV